MSRKTIPPLATTKELSEAGVTRIVMPQGSLPAPACSMAALKHGDTVLNEEGTLWWVWEQKANDVMVYNRYGAVTVIPRDKLEIIK